MKIFPIKQKINSYKINKSQTQKANIQNNNYATPAFTGSAFYPRFNFQTTPFEYKKISVVDEGEYIVAKTKKAPNGLVINPDVVDNFLRDKNGEISEHYLKVFCKTYDKMIEKQEARDFSIQDLYGGALEEVLRKKNELLQIGVDGNIYDIDLYEKRQLEKERLENIEYSCRVTLDFEDQKPKTPHEDAFEKTVIFMEMCKHSEGYEFHSHYDLETYDEKIKMANSLFDYSNEYGIDIATPIINYSKTEPNECSNVRFMKYLLNFFYEADWDFTKIEEVSAFMDKLAGNRNNHWTYAHKMPDLLFEVPVSSDNFMFFLNQCVNKDTDEFNEETFDCIFKMLGILNSRMDFQKAEYVPGYYFEHHKNSEEKVKEYLLKYNDQISGTLSASAPDPLIYCGKMVNLYSSSINPINPSNPSFLGFKTFELGLSHKELVKRTSKEHMAIKLMLTPESPEFSALDEGDKKALVHLVRAAMAFDDIQLQLDNHSNLAFKEFLNEEIKKGNKDAALTKIIFDAQKGVKGHDVKLNEVVLMKGATTKPGKGFYPDDLEKDEFHQILIKMLKEGKRDEVSKILNQRTVVERLGDELIAIDYVDRFKDEFEFIADELEKASKTSTNKDFNEFLLLQAKALRTPNPMLDAYADKKWATLQDTPLEFTITRECYGDELTGTVVENPELKALLDEFGIIPRAKDSLGGRVGIVNKEGTQNILRVEKYLPLMAENMPLKERYEQVISSKADKKQTMVDVDLVCLTGNSGECRHGLVIAENLPNNDKLSIIELNGGKRNVYHRQVRTSSSPDAKEKLQKLLNASLNPELHKYYNNEAHHLFVIGHENGHSLGPATKSQGLGKYASVIEENKADMVSIAMLDVLVDAGMYTPDERNQIIVTYLADRMMPAKPSLAQPHRVRSVMQNYYFLKEGAISISKDGILDIDIEKVIPTAQKMLKEIIEVQLTKDFAVGEKYVLDNFIWTDEMDLMAKNLNSAGKTLNARIEAPLAGSLLEE